MTNSQLPVPDSLLPGVADPPARTRMSLKDEVAVHVREQILSGQLLPGSKIDLDGISDVMGVSKLPVREALIQIESEGLIVNHRHRGAFVAMLAPEDVRDHYHIYGLACGIAASRAALSMTPDQLDALEAVIVEMEGSSDLAHLEKLNVTFHRLINRAGASGRLIAVLRTLSNSLPGRFYELTPGWAERANMHHREILGHLREGDSDAANEAMVSSIREGAEYTVRILTERGYWDHPG